MNVKHEQEQEERITAREAQKMLGVSKNKMSKLLDSGSLPFTTSLLDERVKLVRRSDVEKLLSERNV